MAGSLPQVRGGVKLKTGGARGVVVSLDKVAGHTRNLGVIVVGTDQVGGRDRWCAETLGIPRENQRTEDRSDPNQSRDCQMPVAPGRTSKSLRRSLRLSPRGGGVDIHHLPNALTWRQFSISLALMSCTPRP